MIPYTVVMSDAAKHDEGIRGSQVFWWAASWFGGYAELGLYWFLAEYFGRSRVALMRPSQVKNTSRALDTELLFVGLPTSFGPEHLARFRYKKLVLYDSTDFDGLNFGETDQSFLRSSSSICLKNWRDDRWQESIRIGLLPIKRPPINNKLAVLLKSQSWKSAIFGSQQTEKSFDVGFVARPTGTVATNERLRWLLELKRDRPNLKLWGGLVGGTEWKRYVGLLDSEVLDSCWLNRRKVGFREYFRGLMKSKVALAPRGFAPWSYRHFEAIYANCVVVTNDLSHYEFLIPFPREGMVEVPDGDSVVPGIDKALKIANDSPETVIGNLKQLESWINRGRYSRNRRDLIDRFMAQFETL